MKMHLINPFLRFASSFVYRPVGYEVIPGDNHLIYVADGSVSIRSDGREFHLKKNDILYSPKGVPYEFFSKNTDDASALFISLNFDLTQEERNDIIPRTPQKSNGENKIKKERLINEISAYNSFLDRPYVFSYTKQYFSYFSKILNEFETDNEYNLDLCSCILKELIIRLHAVPENLSKSNINIINEVTEYISNNFEKRLENKFLADLVGYHPNYIGRLFKRNFKVGIQQYIINIRIAEAKKMISETDMSFLEIAAMCGFEDYSYFSAYFKKRTGMSPSAYRKQSRGMV